MKERAEDQKGTPIKENDATSRNRRAAEKNGQEALRRRVIQGEGRDERVKKKKSLRVQLRTMGKGARRRQCEYLALKSTFNAGNITYGWTKNGKGDESANRSLRERKCRDRPKGRHLKRRQLNGNF